MRFPRYRKGLLLAILSALLLAGIGVASAASGPDPVPGYDCSLVVTEPYSEGGKVHAPFKVGCPFAADVFAMVSLTYDGKKVSEDKRQVNNTTGVAVTASGPAAPKSVKVCADYLVGYKRVGSQQSYYNLDHACR